MVITKKKVIPLCRIQVKGKAIKQVNKFICLGKCEEEIKRRIGMAKDAYRRMEKIMRNRKIKMSTKMRILNCYIIPVLTYASETWTISATMEKRLEAAEMWFFRRILKISWRSHTTNEEVLRRAGRKRQLLEDIRTRQAEFFGHVMRMEETENLIVTGKIKGKRDRGRQRTTFVSSLAKWMGAKELEITRKAREREGLKTMVADVLKGYGT